MVNNILLARLFGPANFGVYTLFLKTCNVAGMLSQLGTNAVIVKFAGIASGAGEWGRLKGILLSTFRIVITSSAVMVLIIGMTKQLLAIKLFDSPELYKILIFSALIIPLQNGLLLVKETFRGLQDLKTASLLPVLQQSVLLMLLILLLLKCMTTIQSVLVALGAGIFCSLAAALFVLQRRLLKWSSKPEKIKTSSILKESLPMMITRGSLLVIASMDIYVLGIYTNPTEVGIYGVVNSLADITVFSLGIINQVIPAMIAHYNAQKDFKTLSYVVRFASTLGAFFSVPALIFLILFGKYILVVLFGPQYACGVIALNFLAISQLFNSVSGLCGYMLQMTGYHMVLTRISVFCGLLNFVLNIVLVQYFGKEGVAAATAFSLIVQNTLTLITARRKTGIWTLASVEIGKEIVKQGRRYLWNLFSR